MIDLNIFLSDDYQFELKRKAAAASNGRFENTLDNYFKLFFNAFEQIADAYEVKSLINVPGIEDAYDWLNELYDEFKEDTELYKRVFKDIAYTYELFIRGKHYHATHHIFDVLEYYQMADEIQSIDLGLYYKGRRIKDGDNTNDPSYYYHIPFDKRFLTGNQRFSYSGQPILYLGSSILDVLYELRIALHDSNKVAFASFGYDPLIDSTFNTAKEDYFPKFKIYDITNHIYKTINSLIIDIVATGQKLVDIAQPISPKQSTLKREFKKFILTQICTFKRTHNNLFVEEYVPAQILTEALRINKYHGIKFPSTQFVGKDVQMANTLNTTPIKENLALFAAYCKTDLYDRDLMNYFTITPLDETVTRSKSLKYYCDRFDHQDQELASSSLSQYNSFHNPITHCGINVSTINRIEINMKVDNKPYFSYDFSYLELYAQTEYMQYLVNRFNNIEKGILSKQLTK